LFRRRTKDKRSSDNVFSKTQVLDGEAMLKKGDDMNDELKDLINLLDGAEYQVLSFNMDSDVRFQNGIAYDVFHVRVAAPKHAKTITQEKFHHLSPEQTIELLSGGGRIV
jgi:hypothetical protein